MMSVTVFFGGGMASLVAQTVKNLPAMLESWVWSLGWEDPLGKGKATHSSILAWRIPGTVSPWDCKESDTAEWLSLHFIQTQYWTTHSTKWHFTMWIEYQEQWGNHLLFFFADFWGVGPIQWTFENFSLGLSVSCSSSALIQRWT